MKYFRVLLFLALLNFYSFVLSAQIELEDKEHPNDELEEMDLSSLDLATMDIIEKVNRSAESLFSQQSSELGSVYMTDITAKDEPKMCSLNANNRVVCLTLQLPIMCSDSNSINCVNDKCRVRNSIYGEKSFWVTCDGEWTVIQRRIDGSVDFYRKWADYKSGFGALDGEFWLGLDKLHSLTNILGSVELHIQLLDFNNVSKYARYDSFSIRDESEKYNMNNPGVYSGNAGDSLNIHRYEKFSTYDQNHSGNSTTNCASLRQGAWWYYLCTLSSEYSNLNGYYYKNGVIPSGLPGSGIYWKTFGVESQSMKYVEMKIRPKKLLNNSNV